MNLNGFKRIDFHNHTTISDGRLAPLQVLQRALELDFGAVALTDHADQNNVESIVEKILKAEEQARGLPAFRQLTILPGVELTLVEPSEIASVAHRAKQAGARLVLVHGETAAGWGGAPGTNDAAAQCPDVDILAHPGYISEEAARYAAENNVFVELSGREVYSPTNDHIATVARHAGCKLLVNSDSHYPEQMLTLPRAEKVAHEAGLSEDELYRALITNPEELLERVRRVRV